jgi:hypothetical protein
MRRTASEATGSRAPGESCQTEASNGIEHRDANLPESRGLLILPIRRGMASTAIANEESRHFLPRYDLSQAPVRLGMRRAQAVASAHAVLARSEWSECHHPEH